MLDLAPHSIHVDQAKNKAMPPTHITFLFPADKCTIFWRKKTALVVSTRVLLLLES